MQTAGKTEKKSPEMQGGCRPELGGHAGGLTHLFAGGHGAEGAEAVGVRDHHGRGEARRVGVLWRLLLVRVHCRHTHTVSGCFLNDSWCQIYRKNTVSHQRIYEYGFQSVNHSHVMI